MASGAFLYSANAIHSNPDIMRPTMRYATRPALNLHDAHAIPQTRTRFSTADAIIHGGTLAAVLWLIDVMTFCYIKGLSVLAPVKTIAGGIIGMRAAYADEYAIAAVALGLVLHVSISLVMATVYVVASRTFNRLNRHPIAFGMVYGAMLYVVMNHIVVPLSAIGQRLPLGFVDSLLCLTGHALLVGVPIALFARRAVTSR